MNTIDCDPNTSLCSLIVVAFLGRGNQDREGRMIIQGKEKNKPNKLDFALKKIQLTSWNKKRNNIKQIYIMNLL